MSLKCLMNGLEVNYPCSPTCALFGDCCAAFEAQRKSRVVTNADHIRSMTDEELAKILSTACLGCPVVGCKLHNYASYGCEKAFENWLKQTYKEDV